MLTKRRVGKVERVTVTRTKVFDAAGCCTLEEPGENTRRSCPPVLGLPSSYGCACNGADAVD